MMFDALAGMRRGIQTWQSTYRHASVSMRETLSLLVSAGKHQAFHSDVLHCLSVITHVVLPVRHLFAVVPCALCQQYANQCSCTVEVTGIWRKHSASFCFFDLGCGVCRPLSKTVRFNVLRVIPKGQKAGKKGFSAF